MNASAQPPAASSQAGTSEEAEEGIQEEIPPEQEHPFRRILRAEDTGVRWGTLFTLIVSVGLFALAMRMTVDAASVGLVVAVLLFHELGHFVGMRAFGYRDTRMFFVPYLGAAVTGRASGVSAAKRAVVLLLGPVPGILLGLALARFARNPGHDVIRHAALTLAVLNGLNLLPFEPFDGGKLSLVVLSARHRFLDVASLAVGGLGIAYLAVKISSIAFGIVALSSFMALPRRIRMIRASRALRASEVPLPESIDQAPDATLDVVEKLAREIPLSGAANELSQGFRDRRVAENAREIYDRSVTSHPRFAVSAALVSVQVLALVSAIITVALSAGPTAGRKKPLTVTTTSPDGAVSLHLPRGFRVEKTPRPAEITVTRLVDHAPEVVSASTSPHAAGATPEDGAEALLQSFGATSDIRDAHAAGSCRGGEGRAVEATVVADRQELRRFLCVVEAGGNRFGIIEVGAANTVYDAEKAVLLEMVDAVTFSAPADSAAPPRAP
jgi:Zn-dependent protease